MIEWATRCRERAKRPLGTAVSKDGFESTATCKAFRHARVAPFAPLLAGLFPIRNAVSRCEVEFSDSQETADGVIHATISSRALKVLQIERS